MTKAERKLMKDKPLPAKAPVKFEALSESEKKLDFLMQLKWTGVPKPPTLK